MLTRKVKNWRNITVLAAGLLVLAGFLIRMLVWKEEWSSELIYDGIAIGAAGLTIGLTMLVDKVINFKEQLYKHPFIAAGCFYFAAAWVLALMLAYYIPRCCEYIPLVLTLFAGQAVIISQAEKGCRGVVVSILATLPPMAVALFIGNYVMLFVAQLCAITMIVLAMRRHWFGHYTRVKKINMWFGAYIVLALELLGYAFADYGFMCMDVWYDAYYSASPLAESIGTVVGTFFDDNVYTWYVCDDPLGVMACIMMVLLQLVVALGMIKLVKEKRGASYYFGMTVSLIYLASTMASIVDWVFLWGDGCLYDLFLGRGAGWSTGVLFLFLVLYDWKGRDMYGYENLDAARQEEHQRYEREGEVLNQQSMALDRSQLMKQFEAHTDICQAIAGCEKNAYSVVGLKGVYTALSGELEDYIVHAERMAVLDVIAHPELDTDEVRSYFQPVLDAIDTVDGVRKCLVITKNTNTDQDKDIFKVRVISV